MFYTFGKPPTLGVPVGVSSKKPFSSAASAPSRRWCSCSCGIHGGWIGWTHKKPLNSWLYDFLAGMDLNTQCLRWKLLDCSIEIQLRFRAQMCPNSRLAACWGLLMWNSYTCKIFVCYFFEAKVLYKQLVQSWWRFCNGARESGFFIINSTVFVRHK